MKVEIEGKDLAEALRNAPRGKSTMPILEHALLETGEGILRVQSTDLEATAITEIPAKVIDPGAVCANIKLLAAASRDGTLKLSYNIADHFALVQPRGGSRLRIPILPAADFPIPESLDWQPLPIDVTTLTAALGSVDYAAAVLDVRYYLNGVALMPGYIGASDGHRIAAYATDYTGPKAILPIKQIREFVRLLGPESKLFYVEGTKGSARMLRVQEGNSTLSIALIDGHYPDLQAAFTQGFVEQVAAYTFDREKLLDAARAFQPFLTTLPGKNRADPSVILEVAAGEARFVDHAGENIENCSWALGAHDVDTRVSVNVGYLIETLAAIKADKIRMNVRARSAKDVRSMHIQPDVEAPNDTHFIVGVVL